MLAMAARAETAATEATEAEVAPAGPAELEETPAPTAQLSRRYFSDALEGVQAQRRGGRWPPLLRPQTYSEDAKIVC
jgi:hypothetical protein